MTVRSLGATTLAKLMRADRLRDLDTSWLLFGPADDAVEAEVEAPEDTAAAWRYAAE